MNADDSNSVGVRNLMILYAIVVLLAVAGVALNIIPIFNLKSLDNPKITEEVAKLLTRGFYIIALLYLIIALASLSAFIRKNFSKTFLIVLGIALISTFVFGPFIFEFILGDSAIDINLKQE